MDQRAAQLEPVAFSGDAQILLTGPFYPDMDPLSSRGQCAIPADGVIDPAGRLVPVQREMDGFLRGSLTFGNPPLDLVSHMHGSSTLQETLAATISASVGLPVSVEVTGIIHPDVYGSVALYVDIPGGWAPANRESLLRTFGPSGRDAIAQQLHDALLPAVAEVIKRCSPTTTSDTVLPYFNLTYAGATTHEHPGRATLADELRHLVYPRSAAPVGSDSTWSEEFLFAGYAFLLLASADPRPTLRQLEHLLMHLGLLYARMERSASAADRLVRGTSLDHNVNVLIAVERRLRADYQALVQPTFSYDYHVLKMRDSILLAWETDKVRERTDMLLDMARRAVERQLAQSQARRTRVVSVMLTVLTVLSFVASVDAAVNLWLRIRG